MWMRRPAEALGSSSSSMRPGRCRAPSTGRWQRFSVPRPGARSSWPEWCGPCRRLAPTVEELATDYDGRVIVGKLNVDDNPNVAFRYSIRGIPTLLLFKGGQIVEQVVGLADKDS